MTNLTEENIYVLDSPILSNSQLEKFINFFGEKSITIDCTFDKSENLETSVIRKNSEKSAEIAVRQGLTQLILSDKNISETKITHPNAIMCWCNQFIILLEKKLRGYVSINAQSGEALDTHSFATLIGVGATTVNPYLSI